MESCPTEIVRFDSLYPNDKFTVACSPTRSDINDKEAELRSTRITDLLGQLAQDADSEASSSWRLSGCLSGTGRVWSGHLDRAPTPDFDEMDGLPHSGTGSAM